MSFKFLLKLFVENKFNKSEVEWDNKSVKNKFPRILFFKGQDLLAILSIVVFIRQAITVTKSHVEREKLSEQEESDEQQ